MLSLCEKSCFIRLCGIALFDVIYDELSKSHTLIASIQELLISY